MVRDSSELPFGGNGVRVGISVSSAGRSWSVGGVTLGSLGLTERPRQQLQVAQRCRSGQAAHCFLGQLKAET